MSVTEAWRGYPWFVKGMAGPDLSGVSVEEDSTWRRDTLARVRRRTAGRPSRAASVLRARPFAPITFDILSPLLIVQCRLTSPPGRAGPRLCPGPAHGQVLGRGGGLN